MNTHDNFDFSAENVSRFVKAAHDLGQKWLTENHVWILFTYDTRSKTLTTPYGNPSTETLLQHGWLEKVELSIPSGNIQFPVVYLSRLGSYWIERIFRYIQQDKTTPFDRLVKISQALIHEYKAMKSSLKSVDDLDKLVSCFESELITLLDTQG